MKKNLINLVPFLALVTVGSFSHSPATKYILGLNKYSHDTTVSLFTQSGHPVSILSKERISRKKHDGGSVASLTRKILANNDIQLSQISHVVSNNHHFRTTPYERSPSNLAWSECLHSASASDSDSDSVTSPYNLFPSATHIEVSHHRAHAFSVASQSPFSSGLVVVMDGMGELYSAMSSNSDDTSNTDIYLNDLNDNVMNNPPNIKELSEKSVYSYREAESAYTFVKDDKSKTVTGE